MEDIKVCRVCLIKDAKMYSFCESNLRQIYFQILNFTIMDDSRLTSYICYECGAQLQNYNNFREKCVRGLKTIMELLQLGKLTYATISTVDREQYNLTSRLSIKSNDKDGDIAKSINNETNDDKYNDNSELNDHGFVDNDDVLKNPPDDFIFFDINNDEVNKLDKINEVDTKMGLVETVEEDGCLKTDVAKRKRKIKVKNKIGNVRNRRRVKSANVAKSTFCEQSYINKKIDKNKWNIKRLDYEEAIAMFKKKSNTTWYIKAPYNCTLCYKGFSKEEMLERHNSLCHNEKYQRVCKICQVRKPYPSLLVKHELSHYYTYKCLRCEFETMICSAAQYHERTHDNEGKTCKLCGEVFLHVSSYYTHLRVLHRSQHLCPVCGKSFVSKLGVMMHMRLAHLIVTNARATKAAAKSGASTEATDSQLYCSICDVAFKTNEAYDQHKYNSVKHNDMENTSQERNVVESPRRIRKASRNYRFIGDESRERQQKKYKRKANADVNVCTLCGERARSFRQLEEHHRQRHAPAPFDCRDRAVCELCGKYVKSYNLHIHKNIHTRERLYTCNECGRQFTMKSSLNRHMLKHTGEKPYQCTLCEKRYQQSTSLHLHMRTAHLKLPYPKRNRRQKVPSRRYEATARKQRRISVT